MQTLKEWVAYLLICALSIGCIVPAQAGLVGSGEVAGTGVSSGVGQRERVNLLLSRKDVQAELQKYGVSADEAKTRVATMTDEEVSRLAGSVDRMPAGGDIIGVLFTAFIVLLVTDILGFTKVFPFTRPIR